jgi:hypothetical protein
MSDHTADKIPWFIHTISFVVGGCEYNVESMRDTRQRILAFFARYLAPDVA